MTNNTFGNDRVDNTAGYNTNSTYDYDRYYGLKVVDPAGEKVGDVGQVYLDDQTGRPEWVTVRTGLFGMKETFVPLQGESVEGDEIRVPYTKDQIKGAPGIDPEGHLSEAEEAELYRYYSVSDQRTDRDYSQTHYAQTTGVATDRVANDRVDVDRDRDLVDRDRTDVKRDNLEGDIVRHEERLNVGKEQVEAGRVRIRKHVVNEQQSVQVPVTREEVRVERTPIADGEVRGDNVKLGEGETEVVLHEERPVVSKETVGVERINVGKEQVTENRTVTENVAKEQVEVVQDGNVVRDGQNLRDGDLDRDGVRKESLKDRIEDKIDDMRDKH